MNRQVGFAPLGVTSVLAVVRPAEGTQSKSIRATARFARKAAMAAATPAILPFPLANRPSTAVRRRVQRNTRRNGTHMPGAVPIPCGSPPALSHARLSANPAGIEELAATRQANRQYIRHFGTDESDWIPYALIHATTASTAGITEKTIAALYIASPPIARFLVHSSPTLDPRAVSRPSGSNSAKLRRPRDTCEMGSSQTPTDWYWLS